MSLLEIQNDPDYVNANAATKQAIFDAYSKDDPDYTGANPATQNAIRESFGLSTSTPTVEPSVSVAPQAARAGLEIAKLAPEAASAGYNMAKQGAGMAKDFVMNRPIQTTLADVAGLATHGVPYGMAKNAIMGEGMRPMEAVAKAKDFLMGSAQGDMFKSGGGALSRMGSGLASGARAVGGAVAQGAVAPESAFLMPYQMAAYEQEKIRQNPSAPEYKTNPYAQTVRGEAATQGQAGAMNARNAVATMPFGNVTPQERAILEQDQRDRQQRQAKAVLAQPPTAQNFIARSKAMADLYGGVGK